MKTITNSFALFQKGSLAMYPLLICPLIVVTVAVEQFMFFRASAMDKLVVIPDELNTMCIRRIAVTIATVKR